MITDLGKDLPFGDDVDFHMSAWWNQHLSGTISSEHLISPDIDSRSFPYKDKPSCDLLLKDMNNVETLFRYMKEVRQTILAKAVITYENVWKVSNPAKAPMLFWATVLLSCRCVSTRVGPYPWMEGRDWIPGCNALPGLSALNSVTKRPCGLDKYPTAPTSTGEGSQRGSVTKRNNVNMMIEQLCW